ncbi:hypothetical protein [Actinoplanes sp. GCM10030250]|uniref:hypothetical protein n=1 Tax=Actinoplanes sp. GCM10030250 TaxID=3273376 RepID=UPI00360D3CDB
MQRWIDRAPGAHDWRPFVRYTLQCEGNTRPADDEVTAREDLTRTKITTLVRVDLPHEGIEVIPTAQHGSHGYAAILLWRARRTAAPSGRFVG